MFDHLVASSDEGSGDDDDDGDEDNKSPPPAVRCTTVRAPPRPGRCSLFAVPGLKMQLQLYLVTVP